MSAYLSELKHILAKLISVSRFDHSLRVADTARNLAQQYGVSADDAYLAGLLHDCAKQQTPSMLHHRGIVLPRDLVSLYDDYPSVWHAFAAPYVMTFDFGIQSESVLDSVIWHTTGTSNMSMLAAIIYVADFVEPGRLGRPSIWVRDLVKLELNEAVFIQSSSQLHLLIKKGRPIHPQSYACRDFYLSKLTAARSDALLQHLKELDDSFNPSA